MLSQIESVRKQKLIRQILLENGKHYKKRLDECCHTKTLMQVIDVTLATIKIQDPKEYIRIEKEYLGDNNEK